MRAIEVELRGEQDKSGLHSHLAFDPVAGGEREVAASPVATEDLEPERAAHAGIEDDVDDDSQADVAEATGRRSRALARGPPSKAPGGFPPNRPGNAPFSDMPGVRPRTWP